MPARSSAPRTPTRSTTSASPRRTTSRARPSRSTAYNTLGLKSVAIIDDTETYGKGIADAFAAEWEKLGGTVVGREGAPKGTTDYTAILTKFKDAAPEAVFYGGVTSTGGGLVRKQMPQVGLGEIPYLGGDGIQDGPGTTEGSFINIAGEAAANSFSSVAAISEYPGPG